MMFDRSGTAPTLRGENPSRASQSKTKSPAAFSWPAGLGILPSVRASSVSSSGSMAAAIRARSSSLMANGAAAPRRGNPSSMAALRPDGLDLIDGDEDGAIQLEILQ